MDEESWNAACLEYRKHELNGLLLEDPFTNHAYNKPRGYAGDAGLMDIIYAHDWRMDEQTSELGCGILRESFEFHGADAVRQRRAFIARQIDKTARENVDCDILSVACGHFREIEISDAIQSQRFGSVTGIDQDAQSVDEVNRSYGHLGVAGLPIGVAEILKSEHKLPAMDLVYSLGLFDYLQKPQARRLIASLVDLLKPGGRIIIANFKPDLPEIGYMEAIMDWHLIYRTEEELKELVHKTIAENEDYAITAKTPFSHIAVLEITKS